MSDIVEMRCADVEKLAAPYVLGALEASEEAAVARHLATCSERHPAFEKLGGVVPALFETIEPVDAPAELRGRVMAAIAATPQVGVVPSVGAVAQVGTAPSAVPAPSVTDMPRAVAAPSAVPAPSIAAAPSAALAPPISIERARARRSVPSWWRPVLAAAAVIAIVALAGWNVLLQGRADDADRRASLLSAAIAASVNPSSQIASLRGTGSTPGASGFAAFPPGKPGYIVIDGLPPVPSGRTYQAWFLANGKPTSAGLLSVGSDGLAILGNVNLLAGADTMALTVEPAGGVPQPTGAIVVAGHIGGASLGPLLAER